MEPELLSEKVEGRDANAEPVERSSVRISSRKLAKLKTQFREESSHMRKALWILVAVLFVAIAAPAASADQYTYSFTGACYFAGTSVSFTTTGPAVKGTEYAPNPGATDEFAGGTNGLGACIPPTDEGPILYIEWEPSPYDFCGGTTPCTVEMLLATAADTIDGPTFAGLTVPTAPGTYTEYFDHGTLTISVTTPESSSLALLLSGLGLLVSILAIRKRTPVVLRQAS
jgi:hypothetical protein